MKIKVIHVLNHLKMGGAESLITEYALKINKKKFEIVLVIISKRNNTINERRLEEAGIRVIYLSEHLRFLNANNIFKKLINKFHKYVLFTKIVDNEKPNIIHTHLGTNSYLLPINTKNRNIALFYTIHSNLNALFADTFQKISTKYCIKRKNMIPIALHLKMKHEVNSFFNIDNCMVIPNGIDLNRFIGVNFDKIALTKELNINKDAFIVGHIGRFSRVKNHEFIINVFTELKRIRKNSHLILIGTGELENQIKEQVKRLNLEDSVSFLGNRRDIPELLNLMDVFIFPSLYEGFGNVLIEAQAANVPCVVSDSIPRAAYITNLVTPLSLKDPIEKWCEAIINISNTTKLIEGDLEKYDINHIIKDVEKVYQKYTSL